ncbi:MAG: DUF998 domain-containing protein [Rhizobacter sp.]|nr:DUF998 domain-containing protein [Rhizobacter sp.]
MTSTSTDRFVVRLADVALCSFAIFVSGLVAMHGLRPDYAIASHMISDYAVGRWGMVMTAAFAGASLGCLMLALGVARCRPASVAGWLAAGLFAVASMGLAVTAVYPTDLPGAPSTAAGEIHELSFMVNIASIVLAALLMAVLAFRDERWREHRVPAVVFALLLVLAVVVQLKTLHRGMPYGVANRFVVIVMMTWLGLTAWRLRRVAQPPSS